MGKDSKKKQHLITFDEYQSVTSILREIHTMGYSESYEDSLIYYYDKLERFKKL